MRDKKLSIITINYNNAEGLRKTMESVFAQTSKEFEYIVIDGASTDGSVDVIRASASQAEGLTFTWISEKDSGIYNAMNKGLKMSHGEYTLMLNSGDYLVDEHVIERILPELHTEDMIQGNLIEDHPNKTIRFRGYGRSDISFQDVMEANFPHQAMFIKLSTMIQYGYYDESYKKGSDSYFFFTSLGFGNATYRYVDIDVTNFDINGISSMQDPKWRQIDQEEDARWYGEHISNRMKIYYQEAVEAIHLSHMLRKHKWIWSIVKLLVKISNKVSAPQPNVKVEEIK
ncbi:MAG: glycosyltransferase family 2 protein [Paludibacteraceae bacterium]|nr:glycosyltransferase family 2 protein [Paludibacteraceae bacterium]